MACHSLGIACRSFLEAERTVCLWLVPSNTIRDQTLAALRDREHPYRQAIEADFSGNVRVLDLTEALYVQRGDLDGETCIIVSTLQAFRVEETEGRKVYESNGALSHHFSGLASNLEAVLERESDGTFPHSLANVLRLRRPVVIMDEAHNARTPLSFDTLARFKPSCVIEFTATPESTHKPDSGLFASNVLHHVSAAELKAAEMVKLPIRLRTRNDWKEVIGDAVAMQASLEKIAEEERQETGEYIRPIVLLQAQARSQDRETLTVEVVKHALLEDHRITEDRIAIATGQTREIDDVDLFDPNCPIRYIITVQALKEGWDCSFAYVLCSVAEIGSTRAVEQILGRILRLPKAKWKQRDELNRAYAFAASQRFIAAATALKDALVNNGFQRMEAADFVQPQTPQGDFDFGAGTLFGRASETVSEEPDLSSLDPSLKSRVSYDAETSRLTVTGILSESDASAIEGCFTSEDDRAAVQRIRQRTQGVDAAAESEPEWGPFRIPVMAVRIEDQLELFGEEHFLETEWNVAECDATLTDAEFPSEPTGGVVGEIDVSDAGKVETRFVDELHEQLNLIAVESGWTVPSLANWLDRQFRHDDIPQSQSSLFIHNVLTGLIESRSMTIEQLARRKYRLRDAIEAKIDGHRATFSRKAYTASLFGPNALSIEVSPELCFSYDENRYAPNWWYEGDYRFRKHLFRRPGELGTSGEEYECAVFIDMMAEVKFWVRNLERRPETSFWLQTSTDRFYPDFVAMLTDGRILVVEYKGEHLWSNDDSKEKRAVGELWAERSDGQCIFVMPKGTDWKAIQASNSTQTSVRKRQ
jgi:type III restriction enzyme